MVKPRKIVMVTGSRERLIKRLFADHEEIVRLFDQFDNASNSRSRISIAEAALEELAIHTALEEEIFYPAVREKIGEKGIVDEAEENHREFKSLINELETMSRFDERYETTFALLAKQVRRHIGKEEFWVLARVAALDLDWKKLAREMAALKKEHLNQLRSSHFEAVLAGADEVL